LGLLAKGSSNKHREKSKDLFTHFYTSFAVLTLIHPLIGKLSMSPGSILKLKLFYTLTEFFNLAVDEI
jgi:hypothetical protein